MFSKRDIEVLNISSIKDYFNSKVSSNNSIINNASLETYYIKRHFNRTVFSFLGLLLAAALLNSCIFYQNNNCLSMNNDRWKKISVFVILVAQAFLIVFTIITYIQFYYSYRRQKSYRDINNSLNVINNNLELFIQLTYNSGSKYVSYSTLDSYLELMLESFNRMNRKLKFTILFHEWRSLFIVAVFQVICILATPFLFFI